MTSANILREIGNLVTHPAADDLHKSSLTAGRPSLYSQIPSCQLQSIMIKLVVFLAVLVQLAAALYYKPRPLLCSVSQTVKYQEKVLNNTEVDVLHVPFPINQINLNTIFQTRVVPVTSVVFETATAPVLQVEMTDVQLVEVTEPLTVVKVDTVTSILVETQLDIATSTAINYKTDIESLAVIETLHQTVVDVETRFVQLTKTVPLTVFSTVTVTKARLQTKVVVKTVPVTTVATTVTHVEVREVTSTHSLTKIIINTVCPP
ncbi:uncharacterized protein [Procambarus clarkii]|uniref:uncharacterized protein n=1 Tax=Procambarus clarkii TaxID=6728 RepID=UPI00374360F6